MDLVGFGLTLHDSSVAAYKDGKFLYRKAERQFNNKHAHGNIEWAKSVLEEWDIDNCESAWSTWLSGKNPQKIKEGNKLDHHYTHILSSSSVSSANICLDFGALGPADNDQQSSFYSGMVKISNRQVARYQEYPVPGILNSLMLSKFFDKETKARQFLIDNFVNVGFEEFSKKVIDTGKQPKDWEGLVGCIDFPNKVMALQANGMPDRKQIDEWMKQKYRNLNVILNSYHTPPEQINPDYIATVHKFCEEIVLQKTSYPTFNYTGGVAQNVVFNRAMLDTGVLPHIDPWAYDGGCSIGALNYLLDQHNIKRYADWVQDDEAPKDEPSVYTLIEVSQLLAEGKVVGWYQGNGEVGPRALGNRSILYDPSRKDAKDKVNKIKQREWWRPFGASVLENKASQFFDLPESRHMLFNSNVLYSGIPGVTHVDGTCRHQTVPDNDTPFQWLLTYFELETGLPVLLNTSLNVKGKPLCSTIEQAIQLFKNTELDALCVGDTLYKK